MDEKGLRSLLDRIPHLRIVVIGDLFLDKYLLIDSGLSERSLETGLEAHQVAGMRRLPGAAGTVCKDLRALGTDVSLISAVGDDGEGYDVRRALQRLRIDSDGVAIIPTWNTPTYIKPILHKQNGEQREMNRFDLGKRQELPTGSEEAMARALGSAIAEADGVAISDQVTEPNCGVVTRRVREELAGLAARHPGKFFLADSRARINLFKNVSCKPNLDELRQAMGVGTGGGDDEAAICRWGRALQALTRRPAFVTVADRGIFVFSEGGSATHVPAIPVEEPFDVVGAGDAVMAGILTSLCCGATLEEAAFVGSLLAAVTIKQLGTTGEATPDQIISEFTAWSRR